MRSLVAGACPTNTSGHTGQLKAKLRYDPLGRLHEVENFVSGVAQGPTRFLYDGDALVAEYNASNTLLARYVHGPAAGADDPIAAYTGNSVAASARTNLYADARGSIVMRTASDGTSAQVNTYDEYGIPSATNTGRFQYTGQVWLSELGMNYYKARMYSPQLGRFMQTDPIGYEDNVNLYGYVANDPVNGIDPTGLERYRLEIDLKVVPIAGIDVSVSGEIDTESIEIGGSLEAGPSVGAGADLGFTPTVEQSSVQGNRTAISAQSQSEIEVGIRAGANANLAANAQTAVGTEISRTDGAAPQARSINSAEASASVGSRHYSTTGEGTAPNTYGAGASATSSATLKVERNLSLKTAFEVGKAVLGKIKSWF